MKILKTKDHKLSGHDSVGTINIDILEEISLYMFQICFIFSLLFMLGNLLRLRHKSKRRLESVQTSLALETHIKFKQSIRKVERLFVGLIRFDLYSLFFLVCVFFCVCHCDFAYLVRVVCIFFA